MLLAGWGHRSADVVLQDEVGMDQEVGEVEKLEGYLCRDTS